MSTYLTSEIRKCDEILKLMIAFDIVCEEPDKSYAVNLSDLMESVSKYDFTIGSRERGDRRFFFDFLKELYVDKRWGHMLGDKTEMSRQDFIDHFTNRRKSDRSRQYLSNMWTILVDFGCFVKTERTGVYRANLPVIRKEIRKSAEV